MKRLIDTNKVCVCGALFDKNDKWFKYGVNYVNKASRYFIANSEFNIDDAIDFYYSKVGRYVDNCKPELAAYNAGVYIALNELK